MKDCIDRRVTPPKRVTSPNWVPHLYVNHGGPDVVCVNILIFTWTKWDESLKLP